MLQSKQEKQIFNNKNFDRMQTKNAPSQTDTNDIAIDTADISIPEKFKDLKTGEIKTEELLKSYLALEKKLSERTTSTSAQGTMPANANEYKIELKNDLIRIDPEINQRLFELGFTNEQVQAVYDLAVEKVLPLLEELSSDYKADHELSALEKEFGGAEQFNTIARQISAWGEKNLNPDIFEALCCSKDGILTMYKMMGGTSEPSMMKESVQAYPQESEESLRALMRDPKYWRKNDPAIIKRVEEGFKRLYK